MANEFKVKNGLIVIGDLTTSGTITINGALAATQSWVTSQAYLTSASLSGYATQSYVTSAIAALIDSAPAALDTLNELAAALGDDANFSTTITTSIGNKVSKSGDTMTGSLLFTAVANNVRLEKSGSFLNLLDTYSNIHLYNGGDGIYIDSNVHYWRSQGATHWMALNSTGLGIGTQSPETKLHVAGGKITLKGGSSTDQQIVYNYAREYVNGIYNSSGHFRLQDNSLAGTVYQWDGSTFAFPNGNIGIGTTSPASKLQVVGDIRIQNETGLITDYGPLVGRYNTSQVYVGTGGSYSVVKIGRADGGALNVLSGGNVGIGTDSPNYKLHVAGNSKVDGQTLMTSGFSTYTTDGLFSADALWSGVITPSGAYRVRFGYLDQGGGQYWGRIGFVANTNWSLGTAQGGTSFSIGMGNGNSEFLINNAGKVSIGTSDTNSDKSDFTVYTGSGASLALTDDQVRMGGGDVNWGVALRSYGALQTYGQALTLNTQAGNYAVNVQPNGTTVAQFYQDYSYFPGLDFSISRVNAPHASNYFRGDTSHLVIGTSGTLYLNYGGNTTIITGNTTVSGGLGVSGIVSAGARKLSMGILDLNSSSTPTQYKIKTNIPWNYGGSDFTVNIKGFRYGVGQMVSLSIGWHFYADQFYNRNAISNGAWAPTVSLAKSPDGYVIIYIPGPDYWPKLYVESVYSSNSADSYTSGWSWTDADLSDCTYVQTVPYKALATSISGNAATATSATTAGALSSMNISQFTNNSGYITGYTETDTLASVTNRGESTTGRINVRGPGNQGGGNIMMGNTGESTSKWSYLTSTHYNATSQPQGFALIGGLSTSTSNAVVIGGNIYETNPATEIQFWTHSATTHNLGGTQRGVINSSGNWGIGTASPNQRLSVEGGSIQLNANNVAANYYLYLNKKSGQDGGILFNRDNASDWQLTNGAGNGDLIFYSYGTGTEAITFKRGTGNVGIGVTTPQKKLDVIGSAGIIASFGYAISPGQFAGLHFGYSESASNNDSYKKSALVFERTDNNNQGGNASGKIHFLLNNNVSTSANSLNDSVVTIDSDANGTVGSVRMGIGTKTPISPLEITNTGGTGGGLTMFTSFYSSLKYWGMRMYGIDNGNGIHFSTDVQVGADWYSATKVGHGQNAANPSFQSYYTTYLATTGGNVGVGTTSPSTKLDVNGVISATGGNSTNWNTAYSWGNHASAGYATTSYVTTQINNLIAGAPGALDTLDELAAALGDDANFATTVTNSIAGKVSKSGDTMTGNLTLKYDISNAPDYNALLFAAGSDDYIIKASTTQGVFGRQSFGWHVAAGSAFGVYSSGWVKLFGVEGGTGNTHIFGNLTVNGVITESSSLKLKENVETSEGNLEKVVNLRPVTYNKIGSQTTELGLIAEEVAEVYPEFVQYDENGDPIGVNYSRLTAALIGAVKQLTKRIETLENNG